MILILLFLNYDILKFPQTNKWVAYGTSNKVDSYEKKNQWMMTKFSSVEQDNSLHVNDYRKES